MENDFEKTAIRVSLVSVVWNLILSVFKLIAGFVAHSGAMISDAVHSASDVFSSIIVMIGVRISGKASDKDHPYGHERMECVAAIVLATVLAGTGVGIGYAAVKTLLNGEYASEIPGMLALIAAVVSILVKEAMFWYTRYYAKKIDSSAVMADAWHHRSDALSSVGALIGIGGARLGFPIMEPIASIVICVFIEKAAFDIFKDAIDKMVDKACDEQTEKAKIANREAYFEGEFVKQNGLYTSLRNCALNTKGVEQVDLLKTRIFGNKVYVEMEIGADENLSLKDSHAIAENVHDAIEQGWPKIKHILIHVNPVRM